MSTSTGKLMGSATVVRSGSEWLLTLRNASNREVLTASYPSKPKAKHAADVLMSASWIVTAKRAPTHNQD